MGAPLIARELEADTHRLVWAQGITRERWLLHKLALPMGALMAGTGVAAWFGSWALEGAGQATIGLYWYSPTAFVSTGPAVLGYAALGVALGAMAGTLTRRTLPAMVLTLGAMGAVTALLTTIRSHVVSPVVSFGRSVPQLREEDWVLVQPQAARADRTIFDAAPATRPTTSTPAWPSTARPGSTPSTTRSPTCATSSSPRARSAWGWPRWRSPSCGSGCAAAPSDTHP